VITNQGDAETGTKPVHQSLTAQIMGAPVEVHRSLGPGLLASFTRNAAATGCICEGWGFSDHCLYRFSAKQPGLWLWY
jgi:hypothetical protein